MIPGGRTRPNGTGSGRTIFRPLGKRYVLRTVRRTKKHIADVRADNGIVVEFQHSFIKQEEIASREQFYKNMVWVVDGTRLKTDLSRFHKNKDHLRNIWKGVLFLNPFPEETFNKNWVGKTKPVFFDFSGPQKRVPEGKQKLLVCPIA